VSLHYTDVSLHCTDVSFHYTDVSLHYTDVSLHYTDVSLHYTDVSLHYTDVSLHYIDVSLYYTDVSLHYTDVSPHILVRYTIYCCDNPYIDVSLFILVRDSLNITVCHSIYRRVIPSVYQGIAPYNSVPLTIHTGVSLVSYLSV